MPDNWETYRDWKQLMENIRRRPQDDEFVYDDDTENLNNMFKEYIDE